MLKFEHMHVLIFLNKIARRHQFILSIKNIKVTTKFIVKKNLIYFALYMCNLSIGWYAQNSIYWILIEHIKHAISRNIGVLSMEIILILLILYQGCNLCYASFQNTSHRLQT